MSEELKQLKEEIVNLNKWIADLQSGMYINCVYCGHRYGPEDEVPASMADILKEHIERCPKHPMSKLKIENYALRIELEEAKASTEFQGKIADALRIELEEAQASVEL